MATAKKTAPRPRPQQTRKKRAYKPRQPKAPAPSGPDSIFLSNVPTGAGNVKDDPAAAMLAAADVALANEDPSAGGLPPPADPKNADGGIPLAPAIPNFDTQAFLITTLAGVVDKGLMVSKLAGWPSPAIAGPPDPVTLAPRFLMTEEEWKASVATLSVAIIQKRWPSLADSVTPEFALLVLVLPWAAPNVPSAAIAIYKFLKGFFSGKNSRDHRSDGNGENHVTSEAVERKSEDFSFRSHAGSKI